MKGLSIYKKIFDNCLLGMCFLIPGGFYQAAPVLAIIAFLALLVGSGYKELPFRKLPLFYWCFPALYGLVLLGFFLTQDFDAALSSLSKKLPFLFYPLVFFWAAGRKEFLQRVNLVFLISVLFFLAAADFYAAYDILVRDKTGVLINGSMYPRWSSFALTGVFPSWHPTYVSLFANHGLLILLFGWFSPGKIFRNRYLVAFAVIFLTVNTLLLNSLTGDLCLVTLYLLFLYKRLFNSRSVRPYRLYVLILFLAVVMAGVFAGVKKNEKIRTMVERGLKVTDNEGERNTLTIRLAKWDAYLSIINDNFLTGTTPGDIGKIRDEHYRRKGYEDLAIHRYNAHNQYLEILAVYGVVGLLFFLGALFLPLVRNRCIEYYPLFLLMCCLFFLTESVLERQQGLHYFLFFYTLYVVPVNSKSAARTFSGGTDTG